MTPHCVECRTYDGPLWSIIGPQSLCAGCMLKLLGALLQKGAADFSVPVACVRLEVIREPRVGKVVDVPSKALPTESLVPEATPAESLPTEASTPSTGGAGATGGRRSPRNRVRRMRK